MKKAKQQKAPASTKTVVKAKAAAVDTVKPRSKAKATAIAPSATSGSASGKATAANAGAKSAAVPSRRRAADGRSRASVAPIDAAEIDRLLDEVLSIRPARKVSPALKTLTNDARLLLARTLGDMAQGLRLSKRKRLAWQALQNLLAPIPEAPLAAGASVPQAVINAFAASAAAGDVEKVRRYLATFDPVALCTRVADAAIWLHDDSRAVAPLERQTPKTALGVAVRSQQLRVIDLLLPHSDPMQEVASDLYTNPQTCPLHEAAFFAWMAARGIAIHSSAMLSVSARAAMTRDTEAICEKLLRRAESLPASPARLKWWTEVFLASALWDNPAIAKIALRHADTQERLEHPHAGALTALEIAAHDNHPDVLEVLCADPALHGRARALELALHRESWAAARVLVDDAVAKSMRNGPCGAVRRLRLYGSLAQCAQDDAPTPEARAAIEGLIARLNAAVERVAIEGDLQRERRPAPLVARKAARLVKRV